MHPNLFENGRMVKHVTLGVIGRIVSVESMEDNQKLGSLEYRDPKTGKVVDVGITPKDVEIVR